MLIYVEHWAARPAWRALSSQDRIAYLDRMEGAFERLKEAGGRLVGALLTDETLASGPQYVAVWAMRNGRQQVRLLETILDAFTWTKYFRLVDRHAAGGGHEPLHEHAREGVEKLAKPAGRKN